MSVPLGTVIQLLPYAIEGGIEGDEHGLSFAGVRRLPIETLRTEMKNTSKKPKSWYRAHCAFMGLSSNDRLNMQSLRSALATALVNPKADYLPHLLELEEQAKKQFRATRLNIETYVRSQPVFTPGQPTPSPGPPQFSGPKPTQQKSTSTLTDAIDQSAGVPLQDSLVHVGLSHQRSPSPETLAPSRPLKRVKLVVYETEPVPNELGSEFASGSSTDTIEASQPVASKAKKSSKSSARGCAPSAANTEQNRKDDKHPKAETVLRQLSNISAELLAMRADGILKRLAELQPVGLKTSIEPTSCSPAPAQSLSKPLSKFDQMGVDYATQCNIKDTATGSANFDKLCSMVNLTTWFCRACENEGSKLGIYDAYLRLFPEGKKALVTDKQFYHWITDGYTLLMLIYASTVYILPAIAVCSMSTVINHLGPTDRHSVENILRDPSIESKLRDTTRELTELHIRGYHLVKWHQYSHSGIVLGEHRFGVSMENDDAYIRKLLAHGRHPWEFDMLPRGAIWAEGPATLSPPPAPSAPLRIKTAYNPRLKRNLEMPAALKEDPVQWTANQRDLADDGVRPTTIDELISELNALHKGGSKIEDKYVWFPAHLANQDTLILGVSGTEDDLICIRLSNDTVVNKDETLLRVRDFTRIGQKQVDSAKLDAHQRFASWHVGVWNKRVWNGSNHAGEQHVRLRVAYMTQAQPYWDRSALILAGNRKEENLYDSPLDDFHAMVEKAIEPVIAKLRLHIPKLMAMHERVYASLGPVYKLGSGPFCMTVLNLLPATKGHRDRSDMVDSICLVMALGDFEGGELCLFEPGIVLELPHGTCAAIRSKRDTHFNLNFKGQRFSFVFTSDQVLQRWDVWRNEWEELEPINMDYLPADLLNELQSEDEDGWEDDGEWEVQL